MAKLFWEAVPGLQVSDEQRTAFERVEIEKVVSTRDRSALKIFIHSERLIHKRSINQMEAEIKKQMFSSVPTTVTICEKYHLSAQYTPENLMKAYEDSILYEIKPYSLVLYNLMRKSRWEFTDEHVCMMHLDDALVAHSKAGELKRILEKIFQERCGVDLDVRFQYEEPESKKDNVVEERRQVEEILRHAGKTMGADGMLVADGEAESGKGAGQSGAGTAGKSGGGQAAKSGSGTSAGGQIGKSGAGNGAGQSGNASGGQFGGGKSFGGKDSFGNRKSAFKKKPKNDDVLFGYDFDDHSTPISEITPEMGAVVINGVVIAQEARELRSGKTILIFDVTDYTDTVTVKMFLKEEQKDEVMGIVKNGTALRIRGMLDIDKFDNEMVVSSVTGIRRGAVEVNKRMDTSEEKRVELHCHTKMSDMDGVSEVKDILKRAKEWGMPALAVTDHGCVQGFTDAFHTIGNDDPFKVIYGVEGYLVDDLKEVVVRSKGQSLSASTVVFDIETTGLSAVSNKIIEIGAVKLVNGEIVDRFSTFVNPEEPIPPRIEELTSITDHMLVGQPKIEEVLPKFLEFCGDAVIVAHNASFDTGFIEANAKRMGLPYEPTIVDTVGLSRILLPDLRKHKLDVVAKAVGVSLEHHHRAVDDAECTALIYQKFLEMLKDKGVENLNGMNSLSVMTEDAIKKMPTYHVIILASTDEGRINLYRLVSMAHIDYFARVPRIPKSVLQKYRCGLIVGSACEAGELFTAVVGGASDEEISRIVSFYDYLEIQPIGNNAFMLRSDKYAAQTEEDLRDLNRKIVKLGEQFGKPVAATCDVHFLDPEDEVYRRIIMAGKGFKDCDDQAPLYLRTTQEMLDEFSYLGPEKAREVVITNTNKIAAMCEKIAPVRPDKCPPVIENSDRDLRDMCYRNAHKLYGPELPPIVIERLERELNSIISNGFAVMYIIAQKLVTKSNADGYLVGSRGSVGSSFVATMADITEVNPLSPHYICSECHYVDFDSDDVKAYGGGAGCDMPDKDCPVCGHKLNKAGFDIPFETFLGFKGNKEPDIDLNFSGEYQSHAHDYTEVIFGKGHTFRAGTIGTLADKTAYGYVKNYYQERGQKKRKCEINRIVQGCVGVRRTTGQHPGGIVVLPHGEEIYSFTPVQRPANDMTTKTVTTHFDYHSIDHNLLKLDILGHDDPTMIRYLEELTGLDAKKIPLDSPEVMSLFKNTEALGITPDDIDGTKLGALGIPEFGTDFAMQMLIDAKPQCFSDLVRIAGLSHGTDVWLGNAETLIKEGKATIQTAICTRDDIMIYLISKGMDKELSFTIMEAVRKGKGLKPDWEEQMKAANVPDWYIWSCKKIKYMFPKAHAAAYVMMAWRIAYCKVFYPLAYYAAFFSIRAKGFSYEIMCQGKEHLEECLADYKRRSDELSPKEQDTLRDMRIVQEMYARGYEFWPLDIFRAKATKFQVIDGKIMPSLNSVEGMGDKAAEAVEEASKNGPYLSKEDFWQRTKATKTVIDLMDDLGLLGDIPESNQMSLFDLMSEV